MGFNFFRSFRKIFHNVPIPGVGISINQAKSIYQTVKKSPGGTVIYEPPTTARVTNGPVSGVEVREKSNLLTYAGLAAAAWVIFLK